jgi:hypothetical protein
MDATRVGQLAREHKALAGHSDLRDQLDTEAARREEAKALEQLLHQLGLECAEYCAAYNEAFGSTRVRAEAHAETVIVRSQLDQQDTIVFRRTLPSPGHSGTLEVHRYHYPEHPVDVPVGLKRAPGNTLTITYRDHDVTPADLVLDLLTGFTEQLARADRAGTTARDDTTL